MMINLPPALKTRKRRDGSVEYRFPCPLCGSESLDINLKRGKYKCWSCTKAGSIPGITPQPVVEQNLLEIAPREFNLVPLPKEAIEVIERRGLDPRWCATMYGALWDKDTRRIFWPAGDGAYLRGIYSWQQPKALVVPPVGLIGGHRLTQGQDLVITEGDFTAAVIPHPFIGLGLIGVYLTDTQHLQIQTANPASVTICLDGGWDERAEAIRAKLSPLPARIIHLPIRNGGPDDISRSELVSLLLA